MSNVIPSTRRAERALDAQHVGQMLRDAIPLPPRDDELAILTMMCEALLQNYEDGLADSFVARLATLDATR